MGSISLAGNGRRPILIRSYNIMLCNAMSRVPGGTFIQEMGDLWRRACILEGVSDGTQHSVEEEAAQPSMARAGC
jgi:hypothetical protein